LDEEKEEDGIDRAELRITRLLAAKEEEEERELCGRRGAIAIQHRG
jgi:hypothetical protein